MILKIKHLLEAEDELTRDTKTLQGTLNLFNDYLNKIGTLIPGEITVVDNYGRIQTALSTGDDWINVNINSDVKRPKINFRHKATAVAKTVGDNSDNTNGKIKVPKITTDKAGHITSASETEVSLEVTAINTIGGITNINTTVSENGNTDICT